jgi:DNA-binding MarR family transcriptional regulator
LNLNPIQLRALRAFLRAVALAEPLQSELAASHGLSIGHLFAVRVLDRLGEVPVSRYGAELGLPRSTITNLVDRLERAGLVARVASPTDRRVTLVGVTPKGREALEARARFADSDVARRLFGLDEADQVALAELLEKMLAVRLDSDAGPEQPGPEAEPELAGAQIGSAR